MIVGGRDNVIIRPTTNGPSNAVMGTLLRRYKSLSNVNKIRHPNVIRHLSGSASNYLIVTGGSNTRRSLATRFTTQDARGHCLTIIRNVPSRDSNAIFARVNHRPIGHLGVTMIGPNSKGTTVASCSLLYTSPSASSSLILYALRANEARRVHIRVLRLNRPLVKSPVCTGPTQRGTGPNELVLRT